MCFVSCWLDACARHEDETMSVESPGAGESASPEPESERVDPIKQAEKVKEEGNMAFKTSRFQQAIESYTRAIGAYPLFMHTTV